MTTRTRTSPSSEPGHVFKNDLVDAAGEVDFLEKKFLLSVEFIAALAEDVVRQREAKEMMFDDAKGSGRGKGG